VAVPETAVEEKQVDVLNVVLDGVLGVGELFMSPM